MTAPQVDLEELARSRFVRLSDVEPEQVSWLWHGRIPLGKVCIVDGDPGLGKSTLVEGEMAARITTGTDWPDGQPCPLGSVVILTAEDGLADTIRPRLDSHGADAARVFAFEAVEYGPDDERLPNLALDVGRIEAAVVREGALLVVIDVLMAFLGSRTDAYRDQDVRALLTPLVKMAERTGCAVICLRHLAKSGGANAIYRGGGSIGIIGAARAGLLVALDPEDDTRRVLAVTKNNLAAPVPALAFRLVADTERGCARIEWDGETGHTADQLLATPDSEERTAGDDAADFLTECLAAGPLPAAEVKRLARAAGLAERTVDRARSRARVVTKRDGFGAGATYRWSLDPDHARQPDTHARHVRQPSDHGAHGVHDATDGDHGAEVIRLAFPGTEPAE